MELETEAEIKALEQTLLRCPLCRRRPEFFSRWRAVGSQPAERVYIWVACDGTPPCFTGPSPKTAVEAARGWNEMIPLEQAKWDAALEANLKEQRAKGKRNKTLRF